MIHKPKFIFNNYPMDAANWYWFNGHDIELDIWPGNSPMTPHPSKPVRPVFTPPKAPIKPRNLYREVYRHFYSTEETPSYSVSLGSMDTVETKKLRVN